MVIWANIKFAFPFYQLRMIAALLLVCVLTACGQTMERVATNDAATSPIPIATQELMIKMGMRISSPIFMRIYKKESELEIWKQKDDGLFYKFKSYPICNWSGKLGPKIKQGDKQAPEGFYRVYKGQMNPNSKFHLSFNLGYPNAFDRSYRRTGANLMVHGDCRSAGCYAMTDALVEEIYALAREAFKGGQQFFDVHAYPFRMSNKNIEEYKGHRWINFWQKLKRGSDEFELTRTPPIIRVCERSYHVNPVFATIKYRLNPVGACPGSPNFRPLRRAPPDLTIAGTRRVQDNPYNQGIRSTIDGSSKDSGFDSLSLPDDIFSDDLGGGLRDGLF